MRHLAYLVGVGALMSLAIFFQSTQQGSITPADAQDSTSLAVNDLQTRVAILETQVAAPESDASSSESTYTINGVVGGSIHQSSNCSVGQANVDLGPGDKVTVRDQHGTVLGVGETGAGVKAQRQPRDTTQFCDYPFTITDVPAAAFYTFEVSATKPLGEYTPITFSFEEMEATDWTVTLDWYSA